MLSILIQLTDFNNYADCYAKTREARTFTTFYVPLSYFFLGLENWLQTCRLLFVRFFG